MPRYTFDGEHLTHRPSSATYSPPTGHPALTWRDFYAWCIGALCGMIGLFAVMTLALAFGLQ